jgi:hypothetical protein
MSVDFAGLVSRGRSRGSIVAILGKPLSDEHGFSRYDLSVRRGYLFEFRWSASGELLEDSGYVCEQPRQLAISFPTSPEQVGPLGDYLCETGATSGELLATLGEPTDRTGWWPIENWSYPHGLELELRLGIVEKATECLASSLKQ